MTKYDDYGLLIDYKYCTNCHSCEVACQEEKNLPSDLYGIRVFESKPTRKPDAPIDDAWAWTYLPMPTYLCDLCAERLDAGRKPMCVKHCLAACMEYGPMDELAAKAKDLGNRVAIFKPVGAKTIDIGTVGPEMLSGDSYDASAYRKVTGDTVSQEDQVGEFEDREYRQVLASDEISLQAFAALDIEDRIEFLQGEVARGLEPDDVLAELGIDATELAHYDCVFVGMQARYIPKKNTI